MIVCYYVYFVIFYTVCIVALFSEDGNYIIREKTGSFFNFPPSWPQSHPALQRNGFSCHILKIRRSELYTYPSDFHFCIAIVSRRRHLHIRLERLRIFKFKLFQLGSPGQRTNNIYVDSFLCPFCSRYSGQTTNPLFGRRIRALSVISKQTHPRQN